MWEQRTLEGEISPVNDTEGAAWRNAIRNQKARVREIEEKKKKVRFGHRDCYRW